MNCKIDFINIFYLINYFYFLARVQIDKLKAASLHLQRETDISEAKLQKTLKQLTAYKMKFEEVCNKVKKINGNTRQYILKM